MASMPILHWLVRYVILPTCRANDDELFFRCFLLLAEICAELWLLKHRPHDAAARIAAQNLLPKMSDYIIRCEALFGLDYIKPKHHFMLHLPTQYLKSHCLFDTFTNERKHRLLKQKLTEQKGPLGNPAVLYNVNAVQLREMQEHKSFLKTFALNKSVVQGPYGKVHLNKPICFLGAKTAGFVESFLQDGAGGMCAVVRLARWTHTGVDACGILAHELQDFKQTISLDTTAFIRMQYWLLQDDHLFLLH